jgi:hypothetical protein
VPENPEAEAGINYPDPWLSVPISREFYFFIVLILFSRREKLIPSGARLEHFERCLHSGPPEWRFEVGG